MPSRGAFPARRTTARWPSYWWCCAAAGAVGAAGAGGAPGLGGADVAAGAHVLGHSEGWEGNGQLASQVLARLADDGEAARRLKRQGVAWLHKVGGAPSRWAAA